MIHDSFMNQNILMLLKTYFDAAFKDIWVFIILKNKFLISEQLEDDSSIAMTAHINEHGQLVNDQGQILTDDGQPLVVDETVNF